MCRRQGLTSAATLLPTRTCPRCAVQSGTTNNWRLHPVPTARPVPFLPPGGSSHTLAPLVEVTPGGLSHRPQVPRGPPSSCSSQLLSDDTEDTDAEEVAAKAPAAWVDGLPDVDADKALLLLVYRGVALLRGDSTVVA
jgi:hypothetical protein